MNFSLLDQAKFSGRVPAPLARDKDQQELANETPQGENNFTIRLGRKLASMLSSGSGWSLLIMAAIVIGGFIAIYAVMVFLFWLKS